MAYNADPSATVFLEAASADQIHTFLLTNQASYAGSSLREQHMFDAVVNLAKIVARLEKDHGG